MKETILKVEGLSKQYRLGNVGTGSLADDFKRISYKLRGKEDPFLKIGETNDRSKKGSSDYVWALKDINFEVKKGEVLGIIGRNGAGKSTLLKILSKVTGPTQGAIKYNGKIASLLEVGTGFHGEMTGRENVFLNGAILGMTKKEIDGKIEEIIAFSGCDRYIDTPVKRYSSGMTVRLAFAVAAFLEPDILIIDEVLAVGDVEFQKKAIGKMKSISKDGGRTVLFVSHNLLAVRSLCDRGILLENGMIKQTGDIDSIVNLYVSQYNDKLSSFNNIEKEANGIILHSIRFKDSGVSGNFNINDDLELEICISSLKEFDAININIFFNTIEETKIFATCSPSTYQAKGKHLFKCIIPKGTLNNIKYNLDVMIVQNGPKIVHDIKNALLIEGVEKVREGAWFEQFPGLIRPQNFKWNKNKIDE